MSPPLPPTSQPTWVRWQIVALLFAFSFMSWFNRVSMSVAYAEVLKRDYGISEEVIGTVISTFLFWYMVCMTPGGWFIDRFGPQVALVVMGVGSGLFGALTGLAGLPGIVAAGLMVPCLLVIRGLMGIVSAPIYPAAGRTISFWIPRRRRTLANGLVQGAAALGIACAFPVFGGLLDHVTWPTAFLLTGSFTAFVGLVWALYATSHPTQHRAVNQAEHRVILGDFAAAAEVPQDRPPHWSSLFRNSSLVLLTINYATVNYIEYLFFFWMQYYFKDILKLGVSESRYYSAILHLALAGGMVGGGWLADRLQTVYGPRLGRALVPIIGMSAGAVFLELGLLVRHEALIVTFLALALAAVGACEAIVWTTAVELGGRLGGTAAGICNTGGNAGGLLAPVLTPYVSHVVMRQFGVSEADGWFWSITMCSCLCLVGASLWLWIRPAEEVADS